MLSDLRTRYLGTFIKAPMNAIVGETKAAFDDQLAPISQQLQATPASQIAMQMLHDEVAAASAGAKADIGAEVAALQQKQADILKHLQDEMEQAHWNMSRYYRCRFFFVDFEFDN